MNVYLHISKRIPSYALGGRKAKCTKTEELYKLIRYNRIMYCRYLDISRPSIHLVKFKNGQMLLFRAVLRTTNKTKEQGDHMIHVCLITIRLGVAANYSNSISNG